MGSDCPLAILTAENLTKIISSARAAGEDPLTIASGIFAMLGESVTLSGEVLRRVLADSQIALKSPVDGVIAGIRNIQKSGNHITVHGEKEIQLELMGTSIRFNNPVTFRVNADGDIPGIHDIVGIAVQKFFWIDILQVQLIKKVNSKVLRVTTAVGAPDFDLP